jgi:DNA polymerase-3 subunit alpha
MATVGAALDHAEHSARAAAQVSLFGDETGAGAATGPALNIVREWSESERLAHEKASLGFYLSGHPYRAVAAELAQLVQQSLGALQPTTQTLRIAGVVGALRTQTSRRGKMAFVTLDDGKDQAEIAVFNETFDANRHLLREDALLVAEVRIQQRMNDEGQMQGLRIVAEALYDLPAARRKWARALRLACNGASSAQHLRELIEPFRSGTCPITIRYQNAAAGGDIDLGEAWRVNLDDNLLGSLREWLAPDNVQVVY